MRRRFAIVRPALIISFLVVATKLWSQESATGRCEETILPPLDYAKLESFKEECAHLSLEEVLAKLPVDFRSRYVFVYDSLSAQGATPLFPRVIMFGLDAKLIVAFAGDPTMKGFDKLETIEFDETNKKFLFRELDFSGDIPRLRLKHLDTTTRMLIETKKSRKRRSQKAEINPKKCQNCHRTESDELRPNFDLYGAWPGVYGSREASLERESQHYEIFKNAIYQKIGRYASLEDPIKYRARNENDYYRISRPNTQFTWLVSRLNAQVNARVIRERMQSNTKLNAARYALMGAMTCKPDFNESRILDEWIPVEVRSTFPRSYLETYTEMLTHVERSYYLRERRQCNILRSLPIREPIRSTSCSFPRKELAASNGETVASSARVRYIMEGIGESMESWSLEFSPKQHRRSFLFYAGPNQHVGGLDLYLWKELLNQNETDDKYLYDIFGGASRDLDLEMVFDATNFNNLCKKLSEKSLQAFAVLKSWGPRKSDLFHSRRK